MMELANLYNLVAIVFYVMMFSPTFSISVAVTESSVPMSAHAADYEYDSAVPQTGPRTNYTADYVVDTNTNPNRTQQAGGDGGGFYPMYDEAVRRKEQTAGPQTNTEPASASGGKQVSGGNMNYMWGRRGGIAQSLRKEFSIISRYGLTDRLNELQKILPAVNITRMYDLYLQQAKTGGLFGGGGNYGGFGGGEMDEMGRGYWNQNGRFPFYRYPNFNNMNPRDYMMMAGFDEDEGYWYGGQYAPMTTEADEGFWYNGTFYPGDEMEGPELYDDGFFYNGTFYPELDEGFYYNGSFYPELDDGFFYNGTYYPEMEDGYLYNGTYYPEMEDGFFYNGTFYPEIENEFGENEGGWYDEEGGWGGDDELMWWQLHHPRWQNRYNLKGRPTLRSGVKPMPMKSPFGQLMPPFPYAPNSRTNPSNYPFLWNRPVYQTGMGINSNSNNPRQPSINVNSGGVVSKQAAQQKQVRAQSVWGQQPFQQQGNMDPMRRPNRRWPSRNRPNIPASYRPLSETPRNSPFRSRALPPRQTLRRRPNFNNPNIPHFARRWRGKGAPNMPPWGTRVNPNHMNTAPISNINNKQQQPAVLEKSKDPLHGYQDGPTLAIGIVFACLLGLTLILAPILCMLYRYRQNKRMKKQTLLRRPEMSSTVDDDLVDAIVRSELGAVGGAVGGAYEDDETKQGRQGRADEVDELLAENAKNAGPSRKSKSKRKGYEMGKHHSHGTKGYEEKRVTTKEQRKQGGEIELTDMRKAKTKYSSNLSSQSLPSLPTTTFKSSFDTRHKRNAPRDTVIGAREELKQERALMATPMSVVGMDSEDET